MCGWYANQAPGDGMNLCCVPSVRYFWSGSDDKVLRRLIANRFPYFGAQ